MEWVLSDILAGGCFPLFLAKGADRLTRGNLRVSERLLAQMRRIMDINTATAVTLEVVEAARDRT